MKHLNFSQVLESNYKNCRLIEHKFCELLSLSCTLKRSPDHMTSFLELKLSDSVFE